MTIKPKSFTKSYAYGPFLQYKLEAEISIEEGEDFDAGFSKAQEMCDAWHKKNEGTVWTNPEGMTGTQILTVENNIDTTELDNFLIELNRFKYKEDAERYMIDAGFRLNVQAKNIVNSKKEKP